MNQIEAKARLLAAPRPTYLYSFRCTMKEDGRNGTFTKKVEAKSSSEAWVAVVSELHKAKLGDYVTAIEYAGSEDA